MPTYLQFGKDYAGARDGYVYSYFIRKQGGLIVQKPGLIDLVRFWNFANKWVSADGKSFTLFFTGIGQNDSWNTVRGTFSLVGK